LCHSSPDLLALGDGNDAERDTPAGGKTALSGVVAVVVEEEVEEEVRRAIIMVK